ncbi:hypothetical protein [Psychroserpens algicola]|uniref:DoxX-like family protein n=2 Tax=Psychroserpens algicola TaxID=1719034 RepID=A0ABT0H9Z0_9FLAO|nr:hypothetical protein [Psychroserpens algicola]MCK8481185.1 hypothetical protein [Psychroserpens algicola]
MSTKTKPPNSFWAVAIFSLVWNILELYFSSFEFDFLEKNSTVEEFRSIQSIPIWYAVVFLAALFSEFLGSLMLLMRKKIATLFFAISLITLLLIEFYWLFYFDVKNISVVISIIIPIVVITIAGFLYLYSKKATKNGWLS